MINKTLHRQQTDCRTGQVPQVLGLRPARTYTNYLLLGTDARDNSFEAMNTTGEGNTDAIIIAE